MQLVGFIIRILPLKVEAPGCMTMIDAYVPNRWDSEVGIVTLYGLEGPGIEFL